MTTTSAGIATAPYENLAAALRGSLITPGDPGYDEARAVYNAMIDKRPAAVARCRDVADVIACVRFGREHDVEIAVRGGGHNAGGLGVLGRRPGHRSVAAAQHHGQPGQSHRPRGRRMHLGGRRPRDRGVRDGHPVGFPRVHRRGRPDARRRHRLPVPALRPDRRQPAGRRRGTGRRHVRDGQREFAQRPVLGVARRRRELRRRHVVHVPLPRHRRERGDHRRPGAVRLRRHRRGDALVPRAAALAAGGAERLDRADHHPARAAVPGGAVGPQVVRDRLVLHRTA